MTLDDLREVAADHGLGSATQFGGLHGSVVGNLSDVGPAAQRAAAAFLARQRKHIDNTARRVAFDPTFKCQLCCSKSCRPMADDPHPRVPRPRPHRGGVRAGRGGCSG